MQDADPALIQDAQADAREHLFTGLEMAREANPSFNETETLQKLIDEFGSPAETASAYREVERRTSPRLKQATKTRSLLGRFFAVYTDQRLGCIVLDAHLIHHRSVLLHLGCDRAITFDFVCPFHLWPACGPAIPAFGAWPCPARRPLGRGVARCTHAAPPAFFTPGH